MSAEDADAALRRFERDTVAACLVMAGAALVLVAPWRGLATAARAAFGVLGGGLLVAISYRAIKGAANLLVEIAGGPGVRHVRLQPEVNPARAGFHEDPPVLSFGRRAFLSVKFFTRYALLAVAAYVMLTCFRLHPVGVLAGATSPFLAALMQVARTGRAPRPHP